MSALGWISDPTETRGPLLLAVFWTLLSLSGLVLSLRLWFRWKSIGWLADDYILIIAWLFFLVYTIVNHVAVSLGLGHHALDLRYKNLEPIALLGGAGITVVMIGITAAKISFAVTLLSLMRNLWKWTNWLIWFIIISLIIIVIPTLVFPWVQCKPFAKTYIPFLPGECFDRTHAINYGICQGIYAAITDFILALLPWKVLWSLQRPTAEKISLGMAMSLGLVAGVMAVMRVASMPYLLAQDLSYDGILAIIWAAVELGSTIIAACVPVLRKMVHEEVSTRSRSGPSTNKSGTTQQRSNHRKSQNKATNDIWAHELSLISMTTPEPIKHPLTRWYTTPTPELIRCSEESTFLRIFHCPRPEDGQGHQLGKEISKSESGGEDRRDSEILTQWPEVAHMRGRSFRGTHANSPI